MMTRRSRRRPGAFLPANWIQRYRCNPGQKIQAISNDGSAIPALIITELG
jgi:hypothetical protein